MSYAALLIHPVTIKTPSASISTDRYNNPVPGTSTETTENARIEQKSREELLALRDTRIGIYNFFGSADSVITALSTVTWGNRTFRVTGEPEVIYGRNSAHHVEASLEEVDA